MKSRQGLGWLAAGVLALGLNGFYQDGGLDWPHQAAERVGHQTLAVLALASGRADRFLAEAGQVTAHHEAAQCPFATAMAQVQARVARGQAGAAKVEALSARMEAISARQEAQMARLEAIRARIEARAARFRVTGTSLEAPGMRTVSFSSMQIPSCPRIRVEVPAVRLEMQ
jgi:hypothetical protein